MLLMVEKGIGGGMCSVIRTYAKANNKYMKCYEEDRELSVFNIEMKIICIDGQCLKITCKWL